jgi:hypothetical protein
MLEQKLLATEDALSKRPLVWEGGLLQHSPQHATGDRVDEGLTEDHGRGAFFRSQLSKVSTRTGLSDNLLMRWVDELHQKKRVAWTGDLKSDFISFVRNNHELAFLFAEPWHPFSRARRLRNLAFHHAWLMTFSMWSVLAAHWIFPVILLNLPTNALCLDQGLDPFTHCKNRTFVLSMKRWDCDGAADTAAQCPDLIEMHLKLVKWVCSLIFVTFLGATCAKIQAGQFIADKSMLVVELVFREPDGKKFRALRMVSHRWSGKGFASDYLALESLLQKFSQNSEGSLTLADLQKKHPAMFSGLGNVGNVFRYLPSCGLSRNVRNHTPDELAANDFELLFGYLQDRKLSRMATAFSPVAALCLTAPIYWMFLGYIKKIPAKTQFTAFATAYFGGYFQGYLTFFVFQVPVFYKTWRQQTSRLRQQQAEANLHILSTNRLEVELHSKDAIPAHDSSHADAVNWIPVQPPTELASFSFDFPNLFPNLRRNLTVPTRVVEEKKGSVDVPELANTLAGPVAELTPEHEKDPPAGVQARAQEELGKAGDGNLNGSLQSGGRMGSQLSRNARQQPNSLVGRRVAVVVHTNPEKARDGLVIGVKEGIGRTTQHTIHFDDSDKDEDVILRKSKEQHAGFKFYLLT